MSWFMIKRINGYGVMVHVTGARSCWLFKLEAKLFVSLPANANVAL